MKVIPRPLRRAMCAARAAAVQVHCHLARAAPDFTERATHPSPNCISDAPSPAHERERGALEALEAALCSPNGQICLQGT